MRDDEFFFVGRDGFIENARIVVLVRTREVILMQLDGHTNARCDHSTKELHVIENPLIFEGSYAKIPFEKGVKAIKEELHARQRRMSGRA